MNYQPTRGERNNNPGNIRISASKWQGKIAGADAAFETFDTPTNGIRALAKILLNYQVKYGLKTVSAIIGRWAPSAENNTGAYVGDVCQSCELRSDEQISLRDAAILTGMTKAIIKHENGRCIYPDELISESVKEALS